eukprot:gnl/Chilomastix_caulleri/2765.p1 GENE.gnl/Chilomastix_caulleri/2765~~gnl/Chilomastix_caulleri/2765.p1  ORF type:complete len:133 (-),score=14.19 gnl/Chilomastix_caulleri/2765:100-498(-)
MSKIKLSPQFSTTIHKPTWKFPSRQCQLGPVAMAIDCVPINPLFAARGIVFVFLTASPGLFIRASAAGLNSGVSQNCRNNVLNRVRNPSREEQLLPLCKRSASRSTSWTMLLVSSQSNSLAAVLTASNMSNL